VARTLAKECRSRPQRNSRTRDGGEKQAIQAKRNIMMPFRTHTTATPVVETRGGEFSKYSVEKTAAGFRLDRNNHKPQQSKDLINSEECIGLIDQPLAVELRSTRANGVRESVVVVRACPHPGAYFNGATMVVGSQMCTRRQ
jgi:hypothetical protein